jgi:hypothetical protein
MKIYDKSSFLAVSFVLILLCLSSAVRGESYESAPPKIQAAIFLKLLAFAKELGTGDISIHVVGSPEFADEMKKSVGREIGKAKIVSVEETSEVPSQKPSVLYVGDPAKLEEIIAYTRNNKVLSITGIPDLVAKGVTLGVGVAEGKPKILLNVSASEKEGVVWNPAILKISTLIK